MRVDIGPEVLAWVSGDQKTLYINFVGNAIKFTLGCTVDLAMWLHPLVATAANPNPIDCSSCSMGMRASGCFGFTGQLVRKGCDTVLAQTAPSRGTHPWWPPSVRPMFMRSSDTITGSPAT